jgi:hypothetical protein
MLPPTAKCRRPRQNVAHGKMCPGPDIRWWETVVITPG